jgi:hypothetical protein
MLMSPLGKELIGQNMSSEREFERLSAGWLP